MANPDQLYIKTVVLVPSQSRVWKKAPLMILTPVLVGSLTADPEAKKNRAVAVPLKAKSRELTTFSEL